MPAFTNTFTVTPTPTTTYRVYPNPFNRLRAYGGSLKIEGLSPQDRFKLYSISGEKVVELSGALPGARLEWNGKNRSGALVAAGIYLWVIESANGESLTGKLVIEK
jgi:hypothetical protein